MTCDNAPRRQARLRPRRPAVNQSRRFSRSVFNGAVALGGMMILVGCGGSQDAAPLAVYFDSASKQTVVFPASGQYPAVHPETGQPTLMPAMHCPQCAAWHPVPPPEQLNRAAASARCPRCKSPLQIDGPLPADPPTEPEAGR